MPSYSDSDFVKLNLPPGVNFAINGVTLSLDDMVTASLAETGSRFGALAQLYAMIESDQLQSETIGRYSYTKWKMSGSDYWRLQALSDSSAFAAPSVVPRGCYGPLGGIL